MLTPRQLKERALNKLDAKLFFAIKDKQENTLKIDGVIPSKVDTDRLLDERQSIDSEIDVLVFIKEAVDSYTYNDRDDYQQMDLEDLILSMTKN
jgi:hypothetical protein